MNHTNHTNHTKRESFYQERADSNVRKSLKAKC